MPEGALPLGYHAIDQSGFICRCLWGGVQARIKASGSLPGGHDSTILAGRKMI